MAGQRMLSADICTNERIATCSLEAIIGWTFANPKTDRQGRLPGDPFTLLTLCWPALAFVKGWHREKAVNITEELSAAGLWLPYTDAGGAAVVQVLRFFNHQKIRFDRERRPSQWTNGNGGPDPGEPDLWYERWSGGGVSSTREAAWNRLASVALSPRDAGHAAAHAGHGGQDAGHSALTELNGTEPNRTEPNRGDVLRARARPTADAPPPPGPLAASVRGALDAIQASAGGPPPPHQDPHAHARAEAFAALEMVDPGPQATARLQASVANFLACPEDHEDVLAATDAWAGDRWALNAALRVLARVAEADEPRQIRAPQAYLAKAVLTQTTELRSRFALEVDKALDHQAPATAPAEPAYDPRR